MTTAKITFEGVTKRYGNLTVLDELNLEVGTGEVVTIIGPSGSGKTTVLRVLMTLEDIDAGVIRIGGEPLNMMESGGKLIPASRVHVRRLRAKIGMVFQSFNLFPHLTVLQNCIEAPVQSLGLQKDDAIARAEALLGRVGLIEKVDHFPSQLSGGQQQRVAIARALAMQPEILLFDEPTSALDPEMVGDVLAVIHELAAEHAYTMLLVTHQMGFAREISDRICFFDGGKFLEQGAPDEFFSNPQTERAQRFLAQVRQAT